MLPTILTVETDIVRDDEFGEEHVLNVTVTGAVWADEREVHVKLKSAVDDQRGRFISSPEELSWTEQTWVEDLLAGQWEDENERKP